MDQLMGLPGIKFVPTDSEILGYLRDIFSAKIPLPVACGGGRLIAGLFHEYNAYAAEPWNLPRNPDFTYGIGTEAYYWTIRNKKNGKVDRRAGAGSWKASRRERRVVVKDEDGADVALGYAMQLFYKRDGEETSSGWVMDEYRMPPDPRFPDCEEWAICRVKRNAATEKREKRRKN